MPALALAFHLFMTVALDEESEMLQTLFLASGWQ